MAKKKTELADHLLALITPYNGSILFQGKTYLPGESFGCPEPEAYRLINMGVAVFAEATAEQPVEAGANNDSPLLQAIAAAQTLEELQSFCPEERPSDEIIAAFQQRAEELAELENAAVPEEVKQ